MTVPFKPSVVPTRGDDFLDTLTRTFMETANFVEQDRRNKRAKDRFDTEQQRADLANKTLEQRLEIEGKAERRTAEAETERRVRDPGILSPEQVQQRQFQELDAELFPGDEAARAGAVDPEELGAAIAPPGGLQPLAPQADASALALPEGLQPLGETGMFFDPSGAQRESQRIREQEADFIARELEQRAAEMEEGGDAIGAQSLRDEANRAISRIVAGRPASGFDVQGRQDVERTRASLRFEAQSKLQDQRATDAIELERLRLSGKADKRTLDLLNARLSATRVMIQLGAAAAPDKNTTLAELLTPGATEPMRQALDRALQEWQRATEELDRIQAADRGQPAAAAPVEQISQQDFDDLTAAGFCIEDIAGAGTIAQGVVTSANTLACKEQ